VPYFGCGAGSAFGLLRKTMLGASTCAWLCYAEPPTTVFCPGQNPCQRFKSNFQNQEKSPTLWDSFLGCGERTRTSDLVVMSHASCRCSTPRYNHCSFLAKPNSILPANRTLLFCLTLARNVCIMIPNRGRNVNPRYGVGLGKSPARPGSCAASLVFLLLAWPGFRLAAASLLY
jgi:hypothetical protein